MPARVLRVSPTDGWSGPSAPSKTVSALSTRGRASAHLPCTRLTHHHSVSGTDLLMEDIPEVPQVGSDIGRVWALSSLREGKGFTEQRFCGFKSTLCNSVGHVHVHQILCKRSTCL